MIRAVQLNSDTEFIDEDGAPLFALYDLAKINIFIGANNSGKSRLIRRILSNTNVVAIGDTIENANIKESFRAALNDLIMKIDRIKATPSLPDLIINKAEIRALYSNEKYYDIYRIVTMATNNWFRTCRGKVASNNRYTQGIAESLCIIERILQENKSVHGNSGGIENVCYIPVLRGIENFDSYYDRTPINNMNDVRLSRREWEQVDEYARNSKQIYENKISTAYNIKREKIFTAENLYEDVRDMLLGDESRREKVIEFQTFISESFYDGRPFTIIPERREVNGKTTERLLVKIGDSKERALYDLGDGIKQIITILYKVFENKDEEMLFFIEEPEINLHPGYQTKLMRALSDKRFEKHQFFIVTHSNHLLNSAIESEEISIYKVINIGNRNDKFKIVHTSSKDVEILDILGAKNTSVLMANCSIFIEGISDKIYIEKYLELYLSGDNRKYMEDIHYTFIETGGGNIAHWNFSDENGDDMIRAKAFANKCFIICDNDGGRKKKRKNELRAMVGEDNFFELEVREIENTIKRDVLEKTLFDGGEPMIKKNYNENTKTGGYYNSHHIGTFIDNHYETGKKYSGAHGTINNKIEFARKATKYMNGVDDLTDEAKRLCEKVVAFIERSNR